MADYLLKNVDDRLWRDFKMACSFYGLNMRQELIKQIVTIVFDFHKAQEAKIKAKLILKRGRKKE